MSENSNPAIGGGNGTSGANQPQKTVDRLAKTAHDTVDRLAAAAGPAVDKLYSGASSAKESLHARADALGAMEEEWIANARNYVREHPLTAVGIGLLAGIIVGRLGGRH